MIVQEINLYHPIFRRQPKRFSALAMLQAVAVLLVAGLALYGFDFWQLHNLKAELVRAQQTQQRADAQLIRAVSLFGLGTLQAHIGKLRQRVDALRHLQAVLVQSHKAAQGDAPVLLAVGRSVVPGLWIQSVHCDRTARLLVIRGHSERPSAVPVFVRRLAQERSWAGIAFQDLRIDRHRRARWYAPYVTFMVSTRPLARPS
ncbi:MAG: hypothetical protein M0Z44_02750 [Gammaproteobacteria bacterium]|nr:hypothetical protein [Gammaproteobacteria bacterium]